MKMATVLLVLMLAVSSIAQQVRDTSFRFENANPAFPVGTGPLVCIDEAHDNFHTADGRYWAFAELLRKDGYQVEGFGGKFDATGLLDCSILVSANPGEVGMDDAYPHPSAFTRDDISELVKWVRGGGSLLLIIDHAPVPGAAADLGAVLGINMLDGEARGRPEGSPSPDIFQLENGTLKRHPILAGRAEGERTTWIVTNSNNLNDRFANSPPVVDILPSIVRHLDLEMPPAISEQLDGLSFID